VTKPERHQSALRIAAVSLDCADPALLADFYVQLLDGQVLRRKETSVGIRVGPTVLVPQRVANYRPPTWPCTSIVHLDLTAGDDVDGPTERAIAAVSSTGGPLDQATAAYRSDPRLPAPSSLTDGNIGER
jgi:hypothetical protein